MFVVLTQEADAQGAHCEFRVSLSHKGQQDGLLGKGTYITKANDCSLISGTPTMEGEN